MGEERIFNHRRRWLLRTEIPALELFAGVCVLGALAAMVLWVAVQGDNFNAAERDLPFEILAAQPVEDRLYRTPVKPWISPGKAAQPGTALTGIDLGLFPPSILAGGWAISSRPRRFGADNLFEKINGEAEKFLKQGFQQLHYVALKRSGGKDLGGSDEVSIELFDQGGFAGGLGIFSDHRTKDRMVKRAGRALYYTTPVGAIGFSGRYFFRIAANRESPAVQQKSSELVRAFAELEGTKGTTPLPYRILTEQMGVAPGMVAYQRSNAFQYDFARDFWFGQPGKDGAARMFLHQAASNQAATELYGQIAKEHALEFAVLNHTKHSVLMRHDFLKTHFSMAVRGAIIYGVDNERNAGAVDGLMAKLEGVLRDNKVLRNEN